MLAALARRLAAGLGVVAGVATLTFFLLRLAPGDPVERLLGPEFLAGEGVIQLGETEGIKRSVEAGLGVALIQQIAVQREVAVGTLIALPLRGGDDSRTYLVAYRAGRVLPTAERDFVAVLKASTDHGAMTYRDLSRF